MTVTFLEILLFKYQLVSKFQSSLIKTFLDLDSPI